MNLKQRLREALEELFVSGADQEHSEEEMLSLLEDVDFEYLRRFFHKFAEPVLEYQSGVGCQYDSDELTDTKGICLFNGPISVNVKGKVCFLYGLELWLLADMSLLVTSCFRVLAEHVHTEYRKIQGLDWQDTDMKVDFVDLSNNLVDFCNLASSMNLPRCED